MKLTHPSIKYAAIIVWLHTIIAVVHGTSHVLNHANLSILSNIFVAVIIVLAPLLALLLLSTRRLWLGALLLILSMLASFLFGVLNHFIVPGTDNIAQVMPGVWYSSFLISSILVAISEAVGIAIGVWCLIALERPHKLPGKRDDKS